MTSPPPAASEDPARVRRLLLDQLTFHYEGHLRPKLAGMSDEEYLFEPVPGCWSIRARAQARSPMAGGAGDIVCDFAWPEPDPPPFTTIAWRLAHVSIGIFAMRAAWHFAGPAVSYQSATYPPHAADALNLLDESYTRWVQGIAGLDDDSLFDPVGDTEPFLAGAPMAEIVVHVNREAIHHLAEVLVIRDLWRNRQAWGA